MLLTTSRARAALSVCSRVAAEAAEEAGAGTEAAEAGDTLPWLRRAQQPSCFKGKCSFGFLQNYNHNILRKIRALASHTHTDTHT